MRSKGRFHNVIFDPSLRPESTAIAVLIMLLFLIIVLLFITFTAQPAAGQTYRDSQLHGGRRGNPFAGWTMDTAGNLHGTTCGAAYTASVTNCRHRLPALPERLWMGLYPALCLSGRQ